MASTINPANPTAVTATTASVRDNFQAAKDEIETLQGLTSATQLLLVNDNQADGTTVFADDSGKASRIIVEGAAAYDTAQAPAGMTSSLLCNGSTAGLMAAYHPRIQPGAEDFCLEFAIRSNGAPGGSSVIAGTTSGAGNAGWMILQSGAALLLYVSSNGSTWTIINGANIATLVTNTWTTIVLNRRSDQWQAWQDATRSHNSSPGGIVYNNQSPMSYGKATDASNYWNGWLGPMRWTVGDALDYDGASITPPTFPLS